MNCSNCSEPALYKIAPVGVNEVYYCEKHLPTPYKAQAHIGLYPLDEPVVTTSKKKSAPVVEEAPVEEPVVEEAPSDVTE
ncbi:hypothetical protein UFOVP225_44 [uncultured Caudovirales phage]|uniref:Uncharacterized protein n=1 Tax=uncultured Caudovirales phage TaxID=2100421 RepID=A0A6J7WVK4_9CAUD|nr:hypothetical protein UFOVP113_57 [uncultured Caudovirales phage]CAB5219243.1 hypothetical protein UFOVP225_44 [uncultured Caudovirales phage]